MKKQAILLVVAALVGANAQAGGFEKNLTWSGKYTGIGGAAVSRVEGSESLYFNPAGLATKRGANGDVSLNFSPTFASFKGPLNPVTRAIEETDKSFVPVGGLTASYQVWDRLSVGVGYFVTGGTNAVYENVGLTALGFNFAPELKSQLALTELSVGLGYEVIPGLRLGAAWRMLNVNGDFFFAGANSYTRIEDIKGTEYNGFKLGAQYSNPEKTWGVGVMFRNGVAFDADMRRSVVSGTNVTTVPAADGTIRSTFPWQASIGGNINVTEFWHLHGEFTHTDYDHNRRIEYTGVGAQPIALNWKDQQNYKIGVEYTGLENLALRAGYVLTTQVVPDGTANATFSTPGTGHTIAIGAGRSFLEGNVLDVNVAAERSWAKGDVAQASGNLNYGEYSSGSWAAHLGAAYKF